MQIIIEYTTIGLRISGNGAAEVDLNLTEELRHASYGRAQTCRNRSNVRNSRRQLHVTLKIRDQNPSLGYICPGEPHQRSPNAPKFEDRSQEETEWQERGAREAAWKLAKNVLKLKEHERTTFFSSSEK